MKITNGQQHYLKAIQNNKKAPVEINKKPIEHTSESRHVSVEISDEARKLSEATIQVAPSEKAAAIKMAIQAGTYQVSADKIANGLLEAMETQKKVEE